MFSVGFIQKQIKKYFFKIYLQKLYLNQYIWNYNENTRLYQNLTLSKNWVILSQKWINFVPCRDIGYVYPKK